MPKIFGLGFHKTGSTTLESALTILGYHPLDNKLIDPNLFYQGRWDKIDEFVQHHDCFRDLPWPRYYQELDQRYPGSKFILTTRSEENWILSCLNHYKAVGRPEFEKIYGKGYAAPSGNEAIWIDRYNKHNQEVRQYFQAREKDFLEVNWESGDSWNKLCPFLEKPLPKRPFPHANKGKYSLWEKAIRRLHFLIDPDGFKRKNRDL